MKYIIVPEIISCVLLALIGVYMLFDKKTASPKEKSFRITLVFSILAIINNVASIYAIEYASALPVLLNVYLNTLFYFSVAVTTTMVSITTYFTMFEGRYDEPRLRRAVILSLSVFALEVALVVANLETGWLFYFDDGHIYHRGPLNAIGLAYLAVAIFNVVLFGILERKRVKKSFRLILFVLPAVAAIIGLIQYLYPTTILTGTIIGFSLLTLFIAGQQQRARVDALTELFSREAFFQDISRLCRRKTPYRIIIIALRNFKQVNGQLGQRAGDALLYAVGCFLSHLEQCAAAYRTSGVQFTLLVTSISDEEYEALFNAITERFSKPWKTDVCVAELRAFFADIQCPVHAGEVDEVIASLEYATRLAKQDPNGKPVRFTTQLREQFSRRNYVIAQMEKALREDLFYLTFSRSTTSDSRSLREARCCSASMKKTEDRFLPASSYRLQLRLESPQSSA